VADAVFGADFLPTFKSNVVCRPRVFFFTVGVFISVKCKLSKIQLKNNLYNLLGLCVISVRCSHDWFLLRNYYMFEIVTTCCGDYFKQCCGKLGVVVM